MIVDGTPQPLQAQIWDLYQDTFPANEGLGLAGFAAAFDTTAALIKSGLNIAPNSPTRFDVPGDSVCGDERRGWQDAGGSSCSASCPDRATT